MDVEYQEAMAELHGEDVGTPHTWTVEDKPPEMSLEDQVAIVTPRIPAALVVLKTWLESETMGRHLAEMAELGLRAGHEEHGDESFHQSRYEQNVEAMEEIRDAIVRVAIMLWKEEGGDAS